MLAWLFLVFTVVPLAELWLLLKVGAWLGALPTVALVLATGAAGAGLARSQGVQAVRNLQQAVEAGRMPADALLHAFLVLVAGLMLVTPGLLTDATGLALMVPPVRAAAARGLVRAVRRRMEVRVWRGPGAGPPPEDRTVDAEFRRPPGSGDAP